MSNSIENKTNRVRHLWIKPSLFVLLAAITLALAYEFELPARIPQFLSWVESLGALGPIALGIAYILATVLLIPCFLLTIGAGALFGVFWGSVVISLSSTIGSIAAFIIGRYFARGWVAGKIKDMPKFAAIDRAVLKNGWKIVGLIRLSPLFPYNLINYAFGVTQVSLKDYAWASWLGMIPVTVLYVYFGAIAGDLVTLQSDPDEKTPAGWVFYLTGLAVTILATVWVTRRAKRALEDAIAEP